MNALESASHIIQLSLISKYLFSIYIPSFKINLN